MSLPTRVIWAPAAALAGGADPASAVLWPLSVDGLVILANIGLLTTRPDATARARWSVRVAFLRRAWPRWVRLV
ncbi:MAG: hypothetical protein ACRDSF_09815 [Pseudonocardiaceae bacterium]